MSNNNTPPKEIVEAAEELGKLVKQLDRAKTQRDLWQDEFQRLERLVGIQQPSYMGLLSRWDPATGKIKPAPEEMKK